MTTSNRASLQAGLPRGHSRSWGGDEAPEEAAAIFSGLGGGVDHPAKELLDGLRLASQPQTFPKGPEDLMEHL